MARRQMSLSGELDEGVQVAHVVGSSKDRKSDGWMNYWKQNSGDAVWPAECQIATCRNKAEVGAHVYILNAKSNYWYYILPVCRKCNSSGSEGMCKYGEGWCAVKRGAYVVATKLKADYVLEEGRRKKA
ncbi:hypothetical protein EMCRGX_G007676 [Ephydatia muelleri]